MNFIIDLIAVPLGFIMKLIYNLVGNYGIAIVLFTLFTKLILLPVSYKQQKNAARMQLLNPKLKKIQEKYRDKPEQLQLEQTKLYQEENINPYSSCLTSFIPLILLWGVLAVVYKPMTYIMDYKKPVIEEAKSIVLQLDPDMEKTLSKNSMRQELIIMGKLQQDSDAFTAVVLDGKVTVKDKDGNESEQKLSSIDASFVPTVNDFAKTFVIGGTNLSETPNINPTKNSTVFLFLIPILSGLMQLAMTIYMQHMQKKRNPDMPNMGMMNGMLYFMPLFSVWLAFTVPAGVGFYWLCSSAFSFLQSVGLYAWFNDARVEKIGAAEREKAKKTARRPSMMQKMLEQQQELLAQQGAGGDSPRLGVGPSNRVRYSDDDGERKLSRSEQEEYNTAVIREARKRMASKYGEEESVTETETAKKKK
ncbi:MAG: YidC/Oxa1 family membrane protein insertase [Oscillospiraceae bacterium]|nr:YidC/Oxa1 family membrane protein insertase [Oscillospiraceae bacterium]